MAKRRGYWGYYYEHYPQTRPREVKGGIKAKSKRGDIGETWWSKRWVSVLESFNMGERLTRGRSYARRGQVISIDVQPGVVTAKVQGSRPKPYSVEIHLKPLSDGDWDKVTDVMASQAIFAAKLLSGEMPQNIEDAFDEAKIPLFPTSKRELDTDCSCPDWANPCKHIAAVYYLLAERFDEDPFLIFKLRGRTKDEIIETLREKRAEAQPAEGTSPPAGEVPTPDDSTSPIEECIDTFWRAGEILDSFSVHITAPEIDNAILKRLGDAPFEIGGRNIASILSKAYSIASATALQKASEESREGETI
ncbi:MAG: SWIM zinc finger family protein [bacterium]